MKRTGKLTLYFSGVDDYEARFKAAVADARARLTVGARHEGAEKDPAFKVGGPDAIGDQIVVEVVAEYATP